MPWVDTTIDLFEGDLGASYAAAWPTAVEAWAAADPDGSVNMPWPDMPNALASHLLVFESAVHGWDLLKALGRDPAIPDDLADPANRGDAFKPAVEASDTAALRPPGRLSGPPAVTRVVDGGAALLCPGPRPPSHSDPLRRLVGKPADRKGPAG